MTTMTPDQCLCLVRSAQQPPCGFHGPCPVRHPEREGASLRNTGDKTQVPKRTGSHRPPSAFRHLGLTRQQHVTSGQSPPWGSFCKTLKQTRSSALTTVAFSPNSDTYRSPDSKAQYHGASWVDTVPASPREHATTTAKYQSSQPGEPPEAQPNRTLITKDAKKKPGRGR